MPYKIQQKARKDRVNVGYANPEILQEIIYDLYEVRVKILINIAKKL